MRTPSQWQQEIATIDGRTMLTYRRGYVRLMRNAGAWVRKCPRGYNVGRKIWIAVLYASTADARAVDGTGRVVGIRSLGDDYLSTAIRTAEALVGYDRGAVRNSNRIMRFQNAHYNDLHKLEMGAFPPGYVQEQLTRPRNDRDD